MALNIETTIRNMDDYTYESWKAEMGYGDDYYILKGLQEDELPVKVLCCATDGYYDVETPSGRTISALSHHHLDGFNENGPEL